MGKTIADLCMSDTIATQDALDNWDTYNQSLDGGSIIDELSSNDVMRKNAFKDANFYPKSLILHQDLNCIGTIERAIKFNNFKSLKLLLEFLFERLNTHDYHRFVMSDLLLILSTQQV